MTHYSDSPIELDVACRILGCTLDQIRSLCSMLNIVTLRHSNEIFLERSALDYLDGLLNPPRGPVF